MGFRCDVWRYASADGLLVRSAATWARPPVESIAKPVRAFDRPLWGRRTGHWDSKHQWQQLVARAWRRRLYRSAAHRKRYARDTNGSSWSSRSPIPLCCANRWSTKSSGALRPAGGGQVEKWLAEGGSPLGLRRQGWNGQEVKPGDRVSELSLMRADTW